MKKIFLKTKEILIMGIANKIVKIALKTKKYLGLKMSSNKYLLQDKHTFKPLLIEIEDRPASPVGHFILWAVIGVFTVGVIWLSVSEIDVVVTARGKLVPSGDIKTVQSTYNGNILDILVKEGDSVKKGQLLIIMDTNIIETQMEAKSELIKEFDVKMLRLTALIGNEVFEYKNSMNAQYYKYEKDIYNNEKNSYNQQLSMLEEKINDVSQKMNIAKLEKENKLTNLDEEEIKQAHYKKVIDIIPRIQYIQIQYKVVFLKNEIRTYDNRLLGLNNNLQELSKQKALIRFTNNAKYYKELREIDQVKKKLIVEVQTLLLQKYKYNIVSPVDGYILKLDVNTQESVLTSAQKLMTIVPSTVKLRAKVDVENKDIGYVGDKIEALLKIDTFDFQKYGFIHSKLLKISSSSIEKEGVGLVYEAVLELETNYFLFNGSKKRLKPGMTVTAEMKVGKRKLIEFFIYPAIKYFNEGMSII
ncbi:HlyD family type I secretion periplasmic adaptor subunit [Sulfurimonas sp.]|uniref:HlyD family type I secretion periplasmic adaptor subunit n=1 Tax=Sulfurimonas sp. TaxID=2022749 RepID=UPI002B48185D|nr:HlyD family type I secretion periplasmic adaptor subunit [Sulfurimonas sp.]